MFELRLITHAIDQNNEISAVYIIIYFEPYRK